MSAVNDLRQYLVDHGPQACVRVSSAQARGAAKKYSYWGAVRYELRLVGRDDHPSLIPQERASSDRRSIDLAIRDAEAMARSIGAVAIGAGMPLRSTELSARALLDLLQRGA